MDPIHEGAEDGGVHTENEMDTPKDCHKGEIDAAVETNTNGCPTVGDIDNANGETPKDEIDTQDLTNGIQQLELDNIEPSVEIEKVPSPEDTEIVKSNQEVKFSNAPLTRRDFFKDEDIVYSSSPTNDEIDPKGVNADELNSIDVGATPPMKPKPDPKDRKLLKRSRISGDNFGVDPTLVKEVADEVMEIQEKAVKETTQKKGTKQHAVKDSQQTESCLQRARRTYGRGYTAKGLTTRPLNDPKRSNEPNKDGRKHQKQYFQEELHRLQSRLQRESSKIKAPVKKPFTPNTFNSLRPYYNTQTASYLIELPEGVSRGAAYSFRPTALGLTDPWDDYNMDMSLLPPISRRAAGAKSNPSATTKKKKKGSKERPCGGSTHLPAFPSVSVPPGELTKRSLFYSDVPLLRKELTRLYSDGADQKVDVEFNRTVNDFFRMGLHRMGDYHPINRPHMRACYFAYFQNNKGAKKAVYKCVKEVEKDKEDEEPQTEDNGQAGQTCPAEELL